MTRTSLRILVVEEDFLSARRLTNDIRANGDQVVGPFTDVHDAIHGVGLAQAAILNVRVQDETSFAVADSLTRGGVPFVFLTGHDRWHIPERFSARRVFFKPAPAAALLTNLHREHARLAAPDRDSMEGVVLDMIHAARGWMPDAASAERLVESALLRAIREQGEGAAPCDLRGWLSGLLEREYRERGRRLLN